MLNIDIDNPTWYYLQEANNGLYDLLEFLDGDNISNDELTMLNINEEQVRNMNEYYNYVNNSLQKLRKAISDECKVEIIKTNNKIEVEKCYHDNDNYETYRDIYFPKFKSYVMMYIGLYCAKEVFIKDKLIENPVLSIAFYNGDDKKSSFNQKVFENLKEDTDNKLDFYNEHEDIFITSLDVIIDNQKHFKQACNDVTKFAVDKLNIISNM